MTHNEELPINHYIDAGAVTIWIGSFANVLPAVAALFSIVWFALRIAETRTVQHLLGRYAWVVRKGDEE